jgi:hypothetical protein
MSQILDILVEELVADEDFREFFVRNPRRAVRLANDWGLPFSESEIRSLLAARGWVWDHVAQNLASRLGQAA